MKKYLIIVAVSLMMGSCAVYTPQLSNIPLMTHQGEAQISGTLQIDPLAQLQANIDAAYAITDHIAVQGFVGLGGGSYSLHGKVGYYLPMAHHSVFEAYLGGGYGSSSKSSSALDSLGNPSLYFHSSNQPFYLQLNYGFANMTRAHIDVALGFKGGILSYDALNVYESNSEFRQGTYGLLEPQLILRIGTQRTKMQMQAGYCHLLIPADKPKVNYVPWSISLGICFQLDTRQWRKSQP